MPIPARSILEVKFFQTCNAQTLINVIHYSNEVKYDGLDAVAVTDSLLTVLANNGDADWVPTIAKAQAQNLHHYKVTAQLIHLFRYIQREAPINVVGLNADQCTAQNIQVSIEKKGAAGARSAVGAMHIGGLPQGSIGGGLIHPDLKGWGDGIAAKLMEDLVEPAFNTVWTPGILNKEVVPASNPIKYRIKGITDLFQTETHPEVRVMRRRTVGIGI